MHVFQFILDGGDAIRYANSYDLQQKRLRRFECRESLILIVFAQLWSDAARNDTGWERQQLILLTESFLANLYRHYQQLVNK